MIKRYTSAKQQRQTRTRNVLKSRGSRPRLTVHRSNRYICAQIIDDRQGRTLVAAHQRELKTSSATGTKVERAAAVGRLLAEKAKKQQIVRVMFDRGPYRFHGRVQALAQAAREGGLQF